MGERRVRVEEIVVADRGGGSWIHLLSLFFFVSLIAFLPFDPDGTGIAFAWVMIGLMAIVGWWLPFAFARTNPGMTVPTVLSASRAEKLLCIPAMFVALVGILLSIIGDRAWLLLVALGIFACLLPFIAGNLILGDPKRGQLATLPPLDTCLYRWVPPFLGLISFVAAMLICVRAGSVAAVVALLIAAVWWWLLFLLLNRRPDRQTVHRPTPREPGLEPGCLGTVAWVPLLIWPIILVWMLVGGLPGAVATQSVGQATDPTTTTAALSTASSTTVTTTAPTTTASDVTQPTDPPPPTTSQATTTTAASNTELFWIVLSDGSQYPVWGLLDDTDSVAYVLMASPRTEGCLLISYDGNDVDEWGACVITQIGESRPALPLYEADDGTVLLEIKNPDQVVLTDEIGFAQSAIVSVWDAPVIAREMAIVLFDKTFTAIIP